MSKSETITIGELEIGQSFSWIPAAWYGDAVLTEKIERITYKYDLKYAAAVVNPPGISYGIDGKTKVKLIG